MEHCVTLPKQTFAEFFAVLKKFGIVYAPVKVSEKSYSFRKVSSWEEIAFEALRTILPPKKLFFPQRETLLSYDKDGIKENDGEIEPQVLFGVHPCDLAGLGIMDTIFSAQPADSHYLRRREKTLVVGLSCLPDKHCFCQAMGTDRSQSGYDLFLTDIGYEFFIEAATPIGQSIVESIKPLVALAEHEDHTAYKEFWNKRADMFTTGFKVDNLRAVVAMEWNNPVWEELGKRCLSCGNCTPVCPTCYCSDVIDVASLDGDSGSREREWDSCQFNGFAQVAGDFNFRPTPVDRLKFWYRHKLHGFDDPYGFKTCVGCGRCTVSCPAGIDDIVQVVKVLAENSEKKSDDA